MDYLSDKQFKKDTCFSKHDIPRILHCLQWPFFFIIRLSNGIWCSAQECLLMVLYRFAFPSTMNKVEVMFGRSNSSCSRIVKRGVNLLYASFGVRLRDFDVFLVLARIELYKETINKKSRSAVSNFFALIDRTLHLISDQAQKEGAGTFLTTAISRELCTVGTSAMMASSFNLLSCLMG